MAGKSRTVNVVHVFGKVISNFEYYFKLAIFIAFIITAVTGLVLYGLTKLFGSDLVFELVRWVAWIGMWGGFAFVVFALVSTFGWAIWAVIVWPLGIIKRVNQWLRRGEETVKQARAQTQQMYNHARQIEAQTLSIVSDAKARFQQARYVTVAGRSALAIDVLSGEQAWYAMPTKAEQAEETVDNPFAGMDAVEIFEKIYRATLSKQNCPSFIVAGKKRSGKSTFVEYLTNRYADEAEFVVFDPKQKDPLINWGPTVRLVGQGQNWAEMSAEIDSAIAEIKMMNVDPNRPKRFYVFDEWINLLAAKENKFGEKIFQFMLKVLTEWSYLGVGAIIMPHATTKTAMGFPGGYGELAHNFDGVIRFNYKLFGNERKCYFGFGDNEVEIQLWDPNTAPRGAAQSRAQTAAQQKNAPKGPFEPLPEHCATAPGDYVGLDDWRTDKPVKPHRTRFYEGKDARRHQYIVESYIGGASKRAICEALKINPNGRNIRREINPILARYGVVTDS